MSIPKINDTQVAEEFARIGTALADLAEAQLEMMEGLRQQSSYQDIGNYGNLMERVSWQMDGAYTRLIKVSKEVIESSERVKILYARAIEAYNSSVDSIKALEFKATEKTTDIFPKIDNVFLSKINASPSDFDEDLPISHAPVLNSSQHAQAPSSLARRNIYSFKIEPASPGTTSLQNSSQKPASSLSQQLLTISHLLRNGKESEAMQEFSKLEEPTKRKIFELTWIIHGRRLDYPGDFGEHSFTGIVSHIKSSPQQKASAIEFFIQQESSKLPIQAMIEKLKNNNDIDGLKQIFKTLPFQVQREICGTHWKVCGEPTDQSSDERLRKMAHGNFGEVSFLDLDPRCLVPAGDKIKTLETYLTQLSSFRDARFATAEELVKTEANSWKTIDQSSTMKGQEKNDAKRAALFPFANKLIRLFVGMPQGQDIVAVPAILKSDGSEVKKFEAYAAAYVKRYPCLKPYFLQLIGTLELEDKGQPLDTCNLLQSSQVLVPQLGHLSYQQKKDYLIEVMKDTFGTLNRGYYVNARGDKVWLDLNPAVKSAYCLSNDGGEKIRSGSYRTKLFLVNQDFLTVAQDCCNRKLDPIAIDAASEGHFGGDYKGGAAAQEENFCRRSGLSLALDTSLGLQGKDYYPLTKQGKHAVLYVSNVPVFKGEESKGYPYLDTPFETAVAVMAAENFNVEHQKKNGVQNPKTLVQTEGGQLLMPPESAARTKKKLRTVLEMASLNGHKSIVFVPVGCGAFHNPPAQVCSLLMQLITQEFPHSFEEIHIAIIDDHNTGKQHNPKGNFAPFKDVIENDFSATLQKVGIDFKVVRNPGN